MKIAFICGSMEPGLDGVGDYTRRLAAGLLNKGYDVLIISYKDRNTNTVTEERQWVDKRGVDVIRLPQNLKRQERCIALKDFLTKFDPQWISLQYVPYSYHKRGIAFSLPSELQAAFKKAKVHIMFHELWQGESNESTFKDVILGRLQKSVSLDLITRLKPRTVTTTNEYYKRCFEKAKIKIDKIPVFSNMPKGDVSGKAILSKLPTKVLEEREKYIIAGFFGGFHFHNDISTRLTEFRDKVKRSLGKELLILHVGRSGGIETVFRDISERTEIETCVLGEWPEQDIADLFTHIDVGLSNYPKVLSEKSGSIAALLNNGCPVMILRKGFEHDIRNVSEIKELIEITDIKTFIEQVKDFKYAYDVQNIVERYQRIFV